MTGFNIYEAQKIDDPKKVEWREHSIDLHARDLNGAVFLNANLTKANLLGAKLQGATLDGASAWQRFRWLTLPMLLPQTVLVVTLSTINGFQLFIEPYVMTGGGPLRRTYSIVLYLYTNAFSYQKMGYAATIGVALALMIGALVAIQRRVIGAGEAA